MKNNFILLLMSNLFVFIMTIFIPMNLFIKGIILGGLFFLLVFQYMLLRNKKY